jgi:hypothetical protein
MRKNKYRKYILPFLFFLIGMVLIGVAVFAYTLGLDNNAEWGRSRTILAAAGIGFWCLSSAWYGWKGIKVFFARMMTGRFALSFRSLMGEGRLWFQNLAVTKGVKRVAARMNILLNRLPGFVYWFGPNQRWVGAATLLVSLFVLLGYWWFITAGKMFEWTAWSAYYNLLADAFLQGQVHLLVEPGKELLALVNPYDWDARQASGVDYLWDITFFDGKFFIYWGPVPALILMPIKLLLPGNPVVDDQYLLLGFLAACFLTSMGLLIAVWKEYFRGQPGWLLPVAALVIGFSNPSFWMLGRPSVYETAIVSGQFWLVLGLLFAFKAFSSGSHKKTNILLLISGISLTCAVGSRALLAPPVIFSGLMILWQLKKHSKNHSKFSSMAMVFGVPLLVGAGLLMGYNLARFKDPFEIGLRYQLTGPAMQHYDLVSSIKYVVPNLFGYLVRMPLLETDFPFVSAIFISETMWPFYIRLPEYYVYHEPIVGMLTVVPTLFFFVASGSLLLPSADQHYTLVLSKLRWLVYCLAGNFMITGGLLMIYIFSSMRFQYELVVPGNLLAILGFWSTHRMLSKRPGLQNLVSTLFVFTAIITVFCGWLLGMGEPTNRFEELNIVLYYTIAWTLNGIW